MWALGASLNALPRYVIIIICHSSSLAFQHSDWMCYHAIQLSKGSTHRHLLVVHVEMLSKCCHIGQSLPACCAHQDKHKSCCQNVATLDSHYLLVVHINICKIMLSKCCHIGQSLPTCCTGQDTQNHAIKRLPHQTVITYLLYTLRYTCYQKAATLDSHYLLVVHFVICQLQCKLHTGVRMNTLRLQVFLAIACECGQLHLHPGTLHVKHTPDTFEFQLF